MADEELSDLVLGDEVKIIKEHKDYEGKMHKEGEVANIYLGPTFGCLAPDEIPLVYDKRLPAVGVNREYIENVQKEE